MKHIIEKSFDFCYGHRVHNQKLDGRFATDTCLVCRHLHGHQGKVIVRLESEKLTDGMVTDFKHLGWFKELIDNYLDHKMILDEDDPIIEDIFPGLYESEEKRVMLIHEIISDGVSVRVVPPWSYEGISKSLYEVYEGLVFVNFVPTSENISKWLFEIVEKKMEPLQVKVSSVEFKETPKTSATFSK